MTSGGSYGLAFLLSSIAGLSTLIGAVIPCLVKLSNIKFLVVSLSLAAGVMVYISMVELMTESVENFRESDFGMNPVLAQSLFFFVGVAICVLLDLFIKKIGGEEHHLDMSSYMVDDMAKNNNKELKFKNSEKIETERDIEAAVTDSEKKEMTNTATPSAIINIEDEDQTNGKKMKLKRLGILTALVITLHNIPEGVTTFSSALSDKGIGIMLAVAISIHNIPEGLSVAFPIYYATGSKTKAFLWGAFSGIAEPLAGLGEYIILRICGIDNSHTEFSPTVYGIIFAIVSGIMTYISLLELLPTAKSFERNGDKGTLTNIGFVAGMAIMAISLVFLEVFS